MRPSLRQGHQKPKVSVDVFTALFWLEFRPRPSHLRRGGFAKICESAIKNIGLIRQSGYPISHLFSIRYTCIPLGQLKALLIIKGLLAQTMVLKVRCSTN